MKFEINQKELLKHINIAQKAISSRTTLPILEGILFEVEDNKLTLKATDLELGIKTSTGCMMEEEGKIVINSSMIGNIVRKLPDSTIKFNITGENIQIRCANSEFNLIGFDSYDYPPLPKVDVEKSIKISSEIMKEAIKNTSFAASLDESRSYLMGVMIELEKDYLNFVALDGFRIALMRYKSDKTEEIKEIVPSRSLNELQKIMEEDSEITLSFVKNNIVFDLGDTLLYSRLLERNFFDYKDIIFTPSTSKVKVVKKEFQDALERASLLAREEKANLVKISITENNIHISSNSEFGNVSENIFCEKEGNDLDIAFNAKYLLDGLKVIESDECELNLTDSLKPCIIHPIDEETDYSYLVLPVRLGRQ
ncbi:DNA polymerase III subunit beta [Lagierella sp.]|uniref:DNA polymerase III subunit beta n=1 Tax=Lagierella sp. TaxID=2849657 RepID=UPI0026047CD8|nr:DNA polymerase III subunit beta [Lagierella sp.]